MTGKHGKLYKDGKNGKLMGVCAGVADYTGVDALWIRLALLFVIFGLSGGTALPLYFILGLILNDKPAHLYEDDREKAYWQTVRQSPQRTARDIRGRMRDIDRRMAEVESFYVSSNPRLSAEIDRLR